MAKEKLHSHISIYFVYMFYVQYSNSDSIRKVFLKFINGDGNWSILRTISRLWIIYSSCISSYYYWTLICVHAFFNAYVNAIRLENFIKRWRKRSGSKIVIEIQHRLANRRFISNRYYVTIYLNWWIVQKNDDEVCNFVMNIATRK